MQRKIGLAVSAVFGAMACSGASWAATQAGWHLLSSDAAVGTRAGIYAIDGDPATYSQTDTTATAISGGHPHFVSIDLGRVRTLTGIEYTRPGAPVSGVIKGYSVYVSTDVNAPFDSTGKAWRLVARGEFSWSSGGNVRSATFAAPVDARVVRFVSESAEPDGAGNPVHHAAMAEVKPLVAVADVAMAYYKNFETDPAAYATANDLVTSWSADAASVGEQDYKRLTVVDENSLDPAVPAGMSKILKVRFPADDIAAKDGVRFNIPVTPKTEYFYSYRVFVPSNTINQYLDGIMLPGTGGGTINCASSPVGTDYVASRNHIAVAGTTLSPASLTPTVGGVMNSDCGTRVPWSFGGTNIAIAPNQWQLVEVRFRLNTVGSADGWLDVWLNGQSVSTNRAYTFRTSRTGGPLMLNLLDFSTHLTGVGNGAARSAAYVYFDDLTVSARPVSHNSIVLAQPAVSGSSLSFTANAAFDPLIDTMEIAAVPVSGFGSGQTNIVGNSTKVCDAVKTPSAPTWTCSGSVATGEYVFVAVGADTGTGITTHSNTTASVAVSSNVPPTISQFSIGPSLTPTAKTDVTVTGSANDANQNLRKLLLCKVSSSPTTPDDCSTVLSSSLTDQATLTGSATIAAPGTLATRTYYVYAEDGNGAPVNSANKTVTWKANAYVDGSFTGTSDGSEGAPWKTISAGVNAAQSNQYVYVRSGTYSQGVSIGSTKNGLTLEGQNGATIVLPYPNDATGDPTSGGVIAVNGATGVTVRGFTIGKRTNLTNTHDDIRGFHGVFVNGGRNVTVEDNYITRTVASGVFVTNSPGINVTGNTVEKTNVGARYFYNPSDRGGQQPPSANCATMDDREDYVFSGENRPRYRAYHEMISIDSTDGFTVTGNTVFNGDNGDRGTSWKINGYCVVGKEGIDAKDGSKNGTVVGNVVHDLRKLGIYVDAFDQDASAITVDSNRVYGAKHGIVLAVEKNAAAVLQGVQISNNTFYRNANYGIFLSPTGHTDGVNGTLQNITVLNNTVYENSGKGIYIDADTKVSGVAIYNNIVAKNGGEQIQTGVGTSVGGIVYGSNIIGVADTTGNIGNKAETTKGYPTFSNVAAATPLEAWNFGLLPSSIDPTRDGIDEGSKGTVSMTAGGVDASFTIGTEVQTDATGQTRSGTDAYDMGAYESN